MKGKNSSKFTPGDEWVQCPLILRKCHIKESITHSPDCPLPRVSLHTKRACGTCKGRAGFPHLCVPRSPPWHILVAQNTLVKGSKLGSRWLRCSSQDGHATLAPGGISCKTCHPISAFLSKPIWEVLAWKWW